MVYKLPTTVKPMFGLMICIWLTSSLLWNGDFSQSYIDYGLKVAAGVNYTVQTGLELGLRDLTKNNKVVHLASKNTYLIGSKVASRLGMLGVGISLTSALNEYHATSILRPSTQID